MIKPSDKTWFPLFIDVFLLAKISSMFLKKEQPSEEDLKQKRIDLDESLKRATELRNIIINQKTKKLKEHSDKVAEIRASSKVSKEGSGSDSMKSFYLHKHFLDEISHSEDLEKFQMYMMQKETVEKAADFVSFIEKHCTTQSIEMVKYRPKVFMSIALLAHYPNEVMPNADADESRVLLQAKNFYDSVALLFSGYSGYSAEKHQAISWDWIKTINMFDEWMVKDKTILFEKMKADFLLWAKTIGNLSIDDPSRAEWELHVVKYQNEILERIYAVFGSEHVEIISKEIDNIGIDLSESKLCIHFDSETKKYSCQWVYEKRESTSTKTPQNDQTDPGIFEKLKSTNIQILHELMLKENNVDFDSIIKLSGKSLDEISDTNKETLSYLVSILGTETDGKSIANALQNLFEFICSSLFELAGDNNDYCEEIKLADCSIDSNDWISDSGAIMKWSLSMCKRCCAPARDQMCKNLEHCIESIDSAESPTKLTELFTNAFAMLLDLINLMRRDFCNFRFRSLVAQIDGKGIAEQYELEKLRAKFHSSYEKTSKWLHSSSQNNLKPPLEILVDSYLRIFDPSQDNILGTDTPETFYLDIDRLQRYRDEFISFLKKEAALIYIKNNIKSETAASAEIDLKISSLTTRLENVVNHEEIKQIFDETIEDLSKTSLLKGNIRRLFDDTQQDKVFILLKQRELFKIRTILTSETTTENDTLKGRICALFRYNRSCFSSIYDKIITTK